MSDNPDPIDVHVGARLRIKRNLSGMSQAKLGAHLGLTFQQIQKYEKGANRIGAGRLYRISKFFDVPLSYFFEEMPDDVNRNAEGEAREFQPAADPDTLAKRETLDLVRSYYRITDAKVRKRIFEMVKAIGKK